jgi:heme/copper-type cytochrome/quinol oxidase subunit 4
MAFVRLLRIEDYIIELTIAVALSLAIEALLSMIMIYTETWSPDLGLLVLIGLCVIGVILQLTIPSQQSPLEASDHNLLTERTT